MIHAPTAMNQLWGGPACKRLRTPGLEQSDMQRVTSPTNQRGKLKAVSHRKHLLTGAASVITHQLSLKGKAAADVAEVAINHNPLH